MRIKLFSHIFGAVLFGGAPKLETSSHTATCINSIAMMGCFGMFRVSEPSDSKAAESQKNCGDMKSVSASHLQHTR